MNNNMHRETVRAVGKKTGRTKLLAIINVDSRYAHLENGVEEFEGTRPVTILVESGEYGDLKEVLNREGIVEIVEVFRGQQKAFQEKRTLTFKSNAA